MSTGEDRPTLPLPEPGQNPGQPQPWSPPAAPPAYGPPPQAPSYPTQPTYGEQPQQPAYGQPAFGQPPQPTYGQPAYPTQPMYGEQPPPAYGQTDPTAAPTYSPGYSQPVYGQQPASAPPAYGQQPASAPPAYGQPGYPPPGYPPQPYGAAPYGQPPAPKSHVGRTIAIIAAAVVVLLVLAGGLFIRFIANKVDNPIANGPTTGTTTTAAPTPTPTPFSGDLRTLLLTAPNTSRPFRKPFSADGTLDAAKIATGYTNETQEVNYLNSLGFKQGAIIQWHDANDDQVDIRVYQFGSASDAAEFAQTEQGYYEHDDTYNDQSPASGIDDSGVYVAKKADSDNYVETEIVFSKGDLYVEFAMWQQKKANTTVSQKLARDQFAKLP